MTYLHPTQLAPPDTAEERRAEERDLALKFFHAIQLQRALSAQMDELRALSRHDGCSTDFTLKLALQRLSAVNGPIRLCDCTRWLRAAGVLAADTREGMGVLSTLEVSNGTGN